MVKNALSLTYPNTNMKGDGQIVSISFSDRMLIELLPAFINDDCKTYIFPNSNNGGSWKITDPKAEQNAIQYTNDLTNKNLKKLCRIMRVWKRENNVDIPGILIDILAFNFIQNYDYKEKSYLYYDYMTRDFLKYLSEVPTTQIKWQVMGSGRYIFHPGNFQYKSKVSYNCSLNAIDYESKNNEYSANLEWRKIYGSNF